MESLWYCHGLIWAPTLSSAQQHSFLLMALPPVCLSAKGSVSPDALSCRQEQRKWHQMPSEWFSSCHWVLAWRQQKIKRMFEGRHSLFRPQLEKNPCGCCLRMKGKVRASEDRKRPQESSSWACPTEDRAAALRVGTLHRAPHRPQEHNQCFRSVFCILSFFVVSLPDISPCSHTTLAI